jgi:hypothetical protein
MIQIENILKIADIQKNQVSHATFNYLSTHFITYRDTALKEHLINIQDAIDDAESEESDFCELIMHGENKTPNAEIILSEVRELHALCAKNDTAYIRFIEG